MVTVTLKAKEFYLIAFNFLNDTSSVSFSLLDRIKSGCDGAADDDLVSIQATTDEVQLAYRKLTNSAEGIYSEYNASMFAQLQVLITDGIAANDGEWILLGNTLSAIRTENLSRAGEFVNYAKLKLA
jgi:hypothetical protein